MNAPATAAALKKERDGWAEFIRRNNVTPD